MMLSLDLGIAVLLFSFLYFLYHHLYEKRKAYPAGPLPLPFIGNAHQLGMINPHKKIIHWSKVYGPVFTIWIGSQPNIVITDYNIIKNNLVRQGELFAGRPDQFVYHDIRNGKEFGVMVNDGHIWKEQRRFALHVLRDFGVGKQLMEQKIMAEVEKLVAAIKNTIATSGDHIICLTEPIELCVSNIISSLIMGCTFDNSNESKFHELKKRLDEFIQIIMRPEVILMGQYSWLRHLPLLGRSSYKDICDVKAKFFQFIHTQVEEHREKLNSDAYRYPTTDYTEAYLKEMHRRKEAGEDMGSFTNWQLSVALFDLWIAGTKQFLGSAGVRKTLFAEVTRVLEDCKSQRIEVANRVDTPFLAATVLEVQRCANLVPLILQHSTTKDTVIEGYGHIPRGTAVLPQISSVLLDERFFSNPETFDPSRFLNDDGKTLKNLDMMIPFSLGKRACLGESLARMELFLILGTLIQKFQFSVPSGQLPPSPNDVEPSFLRTPRPNMLSVVSR